MQSREGISNFVIAVSDTFGFRDFIVKNPGINSIYQYNAAGIFLVRTSWKELYEKIVPRQDVVFIDVLRLPKEEVAVSNLDLSTNKVNWVHNRFPQFNGQSLTVSVKENLPDTADIDFKGRYLHTPLAPATLSAHASNMATIIGGAGNSYYEGKGVMPGVRLTAASFATLLPEPDAFYQQYGISVQNHSYGTGIENFYGGDAAAYDVSVRTRPSLVHVFSAGNSGTVTSSAGPYTGVPGFANITGSFKMAKNIITVGHTDSFGAVLPTSSRGPAFDGRIKPELVAFGEDGSSGAAAIVSGIALLIQDVAKYFSGVLPPSSLVKGFLLNGADDVGPPGIDFRSGYGAINAIKALQGFSRYHTGTINTGETHIYGIDIPPNCRRIKLMLVWNDPAASPNAAKALINDLDLELVRSATGDRWKPWVLNHFPHVDSLNQLPVRKRDSLNNIEQVILDNPPAGLYNAEIKTYNVLSGAQPYSLVYLFDTLDKFNWYYPTGADNIFGGIVNVVRWESSFASTTGTMEYSLNNGISWQLISNNVDLSKGYIKWSAPDTFVTALLRMTIGAQNFVSETFTISKRLNSYVGFNCPDSFMLYWNRGKGSNGYQVYRLGDKYMEPLLVTTDTTVILGKQSNPALHYAIAPLINGKTGVRGYGFNYTTQGVGCYIKTFLVQLAGNSGRLDLELGSTYQIGSIIWEKLTLNGFIPLDTTTSISGLVYSYSDNSLSYGLNTYRVKIVLLSGEVIYSQPETLYYLGDRLYIVYPNPARQTEPIMILNSEPGFLQVFNTAGAKLYEKQVSDIITTIPAGILSKGFYFLRIVTENNQQVTLKLVVN